MSRQFGGRHELGQNFLVDQSVIADIERIVAANEARSWRSAPGDGALTRPLSRLGRPITAVEIDPRRGQAPRRADPLRTSPCSTKTFSFTGSAARRGWWSSATCRSITTTATLRWLLAAPHRRPPAAAVQCGGGPPPGRDRPRCQPAHRLVLRRGSTSRSTHADQARSSARCRRSTAGCSWCTAGPRRWSPTAILTSGSADRLHRSRGVAREEILARSAGVPALVALASWLRSHRVPA